MLDYDRLYQEYHPKLLKFFSTKLKDTDYAEDLVQETLLSLWQNKDQYDDDFQLSTWIYTIALNKLKNYSREQSYRNNISYQETVYDNDHTEELSNPEDILSVEQQTNTYKQMLEEFKTNHLEPYYLYEIEEMKYKDIAEELNLTTATVGKRIQRARQYIQQALSQ